MTFRDLIPKSCFSTIATVREGSVNNLDTYLGINLGFINSFNNKVLSINRMEDVSDAEYSAYKKTWILNVPNIHIIESPTNEGHMFGTIDLEERILSYVKSSMPEAEYLFKSMEDVISTESLLDQKIPEASFYYLPGFSYESITKAGSKEILKELYENFESGFYTPQTTFYVLDIRNITSIYGDDVCDKRVVYEAIKKNENPEVKPWDLPFNIKFDCETHLGRTTKKMSKFCIISKEWDQLLHLIDYYKIGDPSHKNIMFTRVGLCHYHYIGSDIVSL